MKTFDELFGNYYDYLWFMSAAQSEEQKEPLRKKWLAKLQEAGWTEENWIREFDLRYPDDDLSILSKVK